MPLDRIHLRKLLKIFFLGAKERRSALREDIRQEIARSSGLASSGGDFYAPFWADAKNHVFASTDLITTVSERIEANIRRASLYPRLRDGFLLWWNQRRRWTNEPFRPGQSIKAQFSFPDLAATVKIDSVLSVRDRLDAQRVIYPYFASNPKLSEESARLGLWLLTRALPHIPEEQFRILDVISGQTFSLDRTPLIGEEEAVFRRRYADVLYERSLLRKEYPD